MSYKSSTHTERLAIGDLDSVQDSELYDLSLSKLSKGLPHSTSSRQTMSMYLRWLDFHCRHPTPELIHWPNTLLHWTQSLRSRGFTEEEVVSDVGKWKIEHDIDWYEDGRYMPRAKDVERAYQLSLPNEKLSEKKRERRIDRKGDSWRPYDATLEQRIKDRRNGKHTGSTPANVYDKSPPSSYVCNRCGKKGLLQQPFEFYH